MIDAAEMLKRLDRAAQERTRLAEALIHYRTQLLHAQRVKSGQGEQSDPFQV